MIRVTHKAKHYLLIVSKVLILTLAFGYIYYKLRNDTLFIDSNFFSTFYSPSAILTVTFFIFLAMANWFFEILKWKILVSTFKTITFFTALKQSLAALTVSLITPNRIGDYGAKALFFKKGKRKRILFLNFIGNSAQLLVTSVFGLIGLVYLLFNFEVRFASEKIFLVFGFILLAMFGVYFLRKKTWFFNGLTFKNIWMKLKELKAKTKIKIVMFSVFRYLIFSSLFYLLLRFFGGKTPYLEAIFLIFAMYLFVSIIPTFFVLDIVVRGGVAIWLFSLVGVTELTVLSAVLAMWILNFMLPAIWGSFYVINHKSISQ